MLQLDSSVSSIPGTGKALHKTLMQAGLKTVRDLLFYFPRRYLDFSVFKPIKALRIGDVVTIQARIVQIASRFSFKTRISLCEAVVADTSGSLKITWFNQPYIAKVLKPGQMVFFAGKVDYYKTLQMSNPVYEIANDNATHTGKIVPMYKLSEKLYNKTLRNLIKQVLPCAQQIIDDVPSDICQRFDLLSLEEAVRVLHFPDDEARLKRAKFRLAFDEVFVQQLAALEHKRTLQEAPAPLISPNISLVKKFLKTLPFALTVGQKKALWQILQDMETKHPMNRLLEGDVGSGKTLVAVIAALVAISRGFQVAMLAPTEILAQQHHEVVRKLLQGFDNSIASGLFTHHHHKINDAAVSNEEILDQLKRGKLPLIIGTHALLTRRVNFKKLGLVVIDEQHRFGVNQRSFLSGAWQVKTGRSKKQHAAPHLLSMSATPIPRTLALSLYSDLDVTVLKEIPQGRQVIETQIIDESKRASAYAFIKQEVTKGRQAFIVTPRVEEGDGSPVRAVKAEYKRLKEQVFKNLEVGLLYGGMKGADKEAVMDNFNSGQTKILVATTVIEIGIDVPNATVMLIEGAERFGLAQLHQLRGRVGRGAHKSYCLLMTTNDDGVAIQRLQEFAKINDGFRLAELDLAERGFGSLFGTDQSGFQFKYSQYMTLKTLSVAHEAAKTLLDKDAHLNTFPKLKAMVEPLLSEIHLE